MNARASIAHDHPLHVGASPGHARVSAMVSKADLCLAFGTEWGPTDYMDFDTGEMAVPRRLMRVDIDPEQIARGPFAEVAMVGDAASVLAALAQRVSPASRDGAQRVVAVQDAVRESLSPDYAALIAALSSLRDAVPDAMLVGDSTQLVYAGNLAFAPGDAGEWLNSSAGFGTLGYGLPAAIGAKLADPDRPSVVLIGDGGIQFTLAELGTAMDEGLPVVVIVWNNSGYGEIRSYMQDRQIRPEGVNLTPPDFTMIARAYGFEAVALNGAEALADAVAHAVGTGKPTLIDVCGVT
jgi:acetolactate synthase-1/2/3 large subunit